MQKQKAKSIYMTKKRKYIVAKRKAITLVSTFLVAVAFIGITSVQAEREIDNIKVHAPVLIRKEQPLSVKEQLWQLAESKGMSLEESVYMMRLVQCESGFNQYAINVNKDGSLDLGVFQINTKWQPQVSRECAFDLGCAFNESFKLYQKSNSWKLWTCDKVIK